MMNQFFRPLLRFKNHQSIVILTALIPIVVFGFLTYFNLRSQNSDTAREHIQQINKQQALITQEYFKKVHFDVNSLKKNISYLQKQAENNIHNIQAMQHKHIFDYYKNIEKQIIALSKKDIFQYIYSFKNRKKDVFPSYIEDLHKYENELKLKNVLMFNNKGEILYSSNQRRLLHKNVKNISESFKKEFAILKKSSHNAKEATRYVQLSLDNYSQEYKEFIIAPFKDVNGFVAIELALEHIQKDISFVSSLGKTAETYLVYKENNTTRLAFNRVVKKASKGTPKEGKYIDLGFTTSGIAIKVGSTHNIELVGYRPIHIKNLFYSMQTTVSYMEVISPIIHDVNHFEQFLHDYKYKNIMLVAKKGKVFYSAKEKGIYQTNIFTGKYAHSFVANSIHKVFQTKKFLLTDIGVYRGCKEKIAQFAIMPILDKLGEIKNIIVLELDVTKLYHLLTYENKLYNGVESFLLSKNQKLRSDIPQGGQKYNIFNAIIKNIALVSPLYTNTREKNGQTLLTYNYQHKKVFANLINIDYSDVHWTLISELDYETVTDSLKPIKYNIFLFLVISSLISLFSMLIITREKKKNDTKVQHQILHDHLTKLPNRKYSQEFLSRTLIKHKRTQTKGAVLFMDLDRFKIINDTHGHKAGDFVLIAVAMRFKETLRENDLIARLGGDEFLMIIDSYKTIYDIEVICKKLLKSIAKPIVYQNKKFELGLSIGIATFPNDSSNATDLLTYSDAAMYKTKENGRNSYTFYDKNMTEIALKNTRITAELKDAITNNELLLYYQPQVDLKTQKVLGTEALVRWQHPIEGFLPPNEFIPIAEESNLIIDLGYWVLEQACKDFLAWQKQGYQMKYIAVNMSSKQLQSQDCIQNVKAILDKLSFPASCLELEITETTLIANFESTINNINAFKEMGIKFSIDDFGTGYSSLSYLKSLKISTLKIDREFIKDMLVDKDDRTIVSAIIAMGHALEYTIVAEGAEEKEEIELLEELSCDIVQGYYFSKPLPSKELLAFIDKGGGKY